MCDIVGCDEPAEFEDEMQNELCEDCMEQAVNEGEEYESYVRINAGEDSWIHDSDMESRG